MAHGYSPTDTHALSGVTAVAVAVAVVVRKSQRLYSGANTFFTWYYRYSGFSFFYSRYVSA